MYLEGLEATFKISFIPISPAKVGAVEAGPLALSGHTNKDDNLQKSSLLLSFLRKNVTGREKIKLKLVTKVRMEGWVNKISLVRIWEKYSQNAAGRVKIKTGKESVKKKKFPARWLGSSKHF